MGFGSLCLLAGSRWLVEAAAPSLLPAGPGLALHAALLAVVLGGLTIARGQACRRTLAAGGLGFCVFALPGLLVAGASGRVAGLTEELAFLLLPVAVVLVVAQGGSFGRDSNPQALLGPALAGAAGAALVVPFTLPASVAGEFWLGGLVVSVGVAGWATVRLHRGLQGAAVFPAAAVIAAAWAGAAAFLPGWHWAGGLSAAEWGVEAAKALLLDGPLLLLGVWCLRELAPVQFSARVLVILLIAIAESFVAARPALTWTVSAGVVLMAGGAGWLLRKGSAGEEVSE